MTLEENKGRRRFIGHGLAAMAGVAGLLLGAGQIPEAHADLYPLRTTVVGFPNILVKEEDPDTLAIRDIGDTTYKNLKVNSLIGNTGTAPQVAGTAVNAPGTASYILFTDGSAIKAVNDATGAADYAGTNAATVIQAASDAIRSEENGA